MADERLVHQHLSVLAGVSSAGRPVYEDVPAEPLPAGRYRLVSSPALADGCAAGDIVRIDGDRRVEVIIRGGNLAIQAYAERGAFTSDQIGALEGALAPLGGLVEAPDDGRFLVVTVPVSIGFPRIESIMDKWSAAVGNGWAFGNVYDDSGTPLNWW
jgi:hypothetical protein